MHRTKFKLKIPFDLFLCFILSLPINKSLSITSPPSDKTSKVSIVRDGIGSLVKSSQDWKVDLWISPPKTATEPVNIVRDGRESGKKQARLESGLVASQYRPARKRWESCFRSEESKGLTKVANATIDQKVITAVIIPFRTCFSFSTFSFWPVCTCSQLHCADLLILFT